MPHSLRSTELVLLFLLLFSPQMTAVACERHIYIIFATDQLVYTDQKDDSLEEFMTYLGTEQLEDCGIDTSFKDPITEREKRISETKKGTIFKASLFVSTADIDPYIQQAASINKLDPLLIHSVIKVESNYNPRAVSEDGAMGLMQLLPETANELNVDDPFDPEQNIIAGTSYLADMIRETGQIDLGLAAYNAGLGNVRKYAGIPPFEETQTYIEKVNRYWELAKRSTK